MKPSKETLRKILSRREKKTTTPRDTLEELQRSMKGDPTIQIHDDQIYRINRYLANAGFGSRREVEKIVLEGRVEINGKKVETLDTKVNPGDVVFVDGNQAGLPSTSRYFIMNKPAGYVVSRKGFLNQPTIYDLLPPDCQNLKYAGRLDRDTRGLLILSDDGVFLNTITHPSRRLMKRYIAVLDRLPEEQELQEQFYRGVEDNGELLRAIRVTVLSRGEDGNVVEIILGQGKNRQIRRMFRAIGSRVLDLYREAVGFFDLSKDPIPEGELVSVEPSRILYGTSKKRTDDSGETLGDFNPWDKRKR